MHPGDLEKALGLPLRSDHVQGLVRRFGHRLHDNDYGLVNMHDRGVTLVIDDDQRVERIDLHGRTMGVRQFMGVLPHGLDFDDRIDAIGERLGAPYGCDRKNRCYYLSSGIEVVYDGSGCASTVTLRTPVPEGTGIIDRLSVREERRGNNRGLVVGAWFVANSPGPLRVRLGLNDQAGNAVPIVSSRQDLGDGAFTITRGARGRGPGVVAEFVPFSALMLPPGTHTLSAEVTLQHRVADTWVAVETEGPREEPKRQVEVPTCHWLRMGVRSLKVRQGKNYDGGATFPPDLAWSMKQQGRVVHTSQTRDDVFSARWSEQTPWFRSCDGDTLVVDIDDIDITFHDEIGRWEVATEELIALPAGHRVTLPNVPELVLGAVLRRPGSGPKPK